MTTFYITNAIVQLLWLAMLIKALWQLRFVRSASTILQVAGLVLVVGWLIADSIFYDPTFGVFADRLPSANWTEWWVVVQKWLTSTAIIFFAIGYCLRPISKA